jgi:ribosomal protein S12 methylthiotransferase
LIKDGKGFYILTLGCPKNEVDSDHLVYALKRCGWRQEEKPEHADLLIVNTCSFIIEAVKEAVEVILDLCDYKGEDGARLMVAGCLVARYGSSTLASIMPEVDMFLDFEDYDRLESLAASLFGESVGEDAHHISRGLSSTLDKGYVYIKISEGCARRCAFCTIPAIRGPLISRSWEDICKEGSWFVELGARELVLIAQDTTAYGVDLYGKPSLPFLLRHLVEMDGDYRIRVMYMHPEGVDQDIIDCMQDPKLYPYMDLGMQHADPVVLQAMGRKGGSETFEALIDKVRDELGKVALRSSFIVGFPGEDKESFSILYDFISRTRFDWIGLFRYSQEEDTPAFSLGSGVPAAVAEKRIRDLTEIQEEIMREHALAQVGSSIRVLVEGRSCEAPGYWEARSWREAPSIDGVVFIDDHESLSPGMWCEVEIKGTEGIDLIGAIRARA